MQRVSFRRSACIVDVQYSGRNLLSRKKGSFATPYYLNSIASEVCAEFHEIATYNVFLPRNCAVGMRNEHQRT